MAGRVGNGPCGGCGCCMGRGRCGGNGFINGIIIVLAAVCSCIGNCKSGGI